MLNPILQEKLPITQQNINIVHKKRTYSVTLQFIISKTRLVPGVVGEGA